MSEFNLVVSARMHPIIAAQTQDVVSFVVARSAKMKALMGRFKIAGENIDELTCDSPAG